MIRLGDHRAWARAYGRGDRRKPRHAAFEAIRGDDDRRVARPGFRFTRIAGATLIAVVVSAAGWALLVAIVVMVAHHHPVGRGS